MKRQSPDTDVGAPALEAIKSRPSSMATKNQPELKKRARTVETRVLVYLKTLNR